MPRALALETSGRIGSVALAIDGRTVATETFEHGLQNAAKMLPIIDGLCRSQSWSPREINDVYVSAGPGSFTGLRIAVTIAKTMALASGAKLVAVPSTRVLVENAPPDAKHVTIVLDAKRGQIFTARFERGGERWTEVEPAHLDRLVDVIARAPRPLYLVGEGIPYHRDAIAPAASDVIVTDEGAWRARADTVARIGFEMSQRGEFTPPDELTPIYIRLPEAEEKRLAATNNNAEK